MSRRIQVFVLCEDLQAQTLIRQYLVKRGFPRRSIQFDALPSGAGCGSQWVRERYAGAVHVNRTRHVAKALIVHIDADNHTAVARHDELARALADAGRVPRAADELIALVVPRWETETWLLHYQGVGDISEEISYKRKFPRDQADAAEPTAAALLRLVTRQEEVPGNLPALGLSVEELRRLP